jgi:hypothetical protein
MVPTAVSTPSIPITGEITNAITMAMGTPSASALHIIGDAAGGSVGRSGP